MSKLLLTRIPALKILILIFLISAASGCRRQTPTQEQESTIPFTATESGTVSTEKVDDQFDQQNPAAKIPLDSADMLITIVDANLDFERNDEQLLAVKARNQSNSKIRIIIAAFDNAKNDYRKAEEIETNSTNARAFNLSLVDLIGDHVLEIACRGMNEAGEQTMDVYRKSISPNASGIYYSQICKLAIKGTIEPVEIGRSAEYREGNANGLSFPIITLAQDENSKNLLDLIQSTYFWNHSLNSYELDHVEKIAGKKVQKEQLAELYRQPAMEFESHLHGSWYLVEEKPTPITERLTALNFDTTYRRFSIFNGEIQEVYSWNNTFKRLAYRIELNGVNELVPYMVRQLTIEVKEIDTIQVIGKNEPWAGTYKKINQAMLNTLTKGSIRSDGLPEDAPFLEGHYLSDTGSEFFFNEPQFTLIGNDEELSGGFSIYEANATVLELKVLDKAGLVADSRRFKLDYSEEKRDDKIFRTLFLTPGIIGIYGFEPTSEEFVRFEQIESVDSE